MPLDRDLISRKIADIKFSISEINRIASKPFENLSIDEKYSMRYNIVVLVEALIALCTHIAMELYSFKPSTYRESIRIVSEKLNIPCTKDIEALIGLRNLLIHRYWIIDDEEIYKNTRRNFTCLETLIKRIEEELL